MTQAFRSWHIIMISLSWTFHICCGVYPTQYEPTAVSDFRCRCANTVLQYNIWPLCSIFFYKRKTEIIKNIFGLFLGLICVCIGICMANLYSSVKATCANYNRLVRIEEGHIPTPSYQRAEEIGVELIDLPPPEPNIQENAKQKFASSPSNNKTKRKKKSIYVN